jgi:hypothetical protein
MTSAAQPSTDPSSVEQLHADLAFADRMIAESEEHIARLKKAIAEMSHEGQNTSLARDVLASFVSALTRHEAQRRLVATLLARAAPADSSERASPSTTGVPHRKGARRTLTTRPGGRRRKR